jgi:hypothetical protein
MVSREDTNPTHSRRRDNKDHSTSAAGGLAAAALIMQQPTACTMDATSLTSARMYSAANDKQYRHSISDTRRGTAACVPQVHTHADQLLSHMVHQAYQAHRSQHQWKACTHAPGGVTPAPAPAVCNTVTSTQGGGTSCKHNRHDSYHLPCVHTCNQMIQLVTEAATGVRKDPNAPCCQRLPRLHSPEGATSDPPT